MDDLKKGIDFIGVGSGAIIFNDKGNVFIAKRGKGARNEHGKWDFPGGSVEFGEKCEDAVKREEIKWVNLKEIDPHLLTKPSKSNYKKYIEKYGFIAPKK